MADDDLSERITQLYKDLLGSDDDESVLDSSETSTALVVHPEHESDLDFSDSEDFEVDTRDTQWTSEVHLPERFQFTGSGGVKDPDLYSLRDPLQFYQRFITAELVELIVEETNRYGSNKYDDWEVFNEREFFNFIAICFQMGLEVRSELKDYWSKRKVFSDSFASKLITRSRFLRILNSLHFVDNDTVDKRNRLYKIQPVLDLLNREFDSAYSPGRNVCIDENLVPFRGRVVFRQYIHGKRHKFGIKLYKLCCASGYTCKFLVYAGREERTCPASQKVVVDLMAPYLNEGRILTADNYYTSIPLAEALMLEKTHYVGTLRKNRMGIPEEVKKAKIRKGEVISAQNQNGVTILKWKDKGEIYMLSTYHDDSISGSGKPEMVEDYNQAKCPIDLSDQMCAYTPFVRKTTKWYLRLFFHLVTQTSIVNAWFIFCEVKEKISIKEFKCSIIESLLEERSSSMTSSTSSLTSTPVLCEAEGPKKSSRRRCINCYANLTRTRDAPYARAHAKLVNTKCSSCGQFFCLECFQAFHRKCSTHCKACKTCAFESFSIFMLHHCYSTVLLRRQHFHRCIMKSVLISLLQYAQKVLFPLFLMNRADQLLPTITLFHRFSCALPSRKQYTVQKWSAAQTSLAMVDIANEKVRSIQKSACIHVFGLFFCQESDAGNSFRNKNFFSGIAAALGL